MIDFAALMNFAFENRLYESEVHGIEHWHQVEYNGLLLAKKTGADIDVVRLFAIFHDSQRLDDAYDREHGARGAEFAQRWREEKRFELDDERFGPCRVSAGSQENGDGMGCKNSPEVADFGLYRIPHARVDPQIGALIIP